MYKSFYQRKPLANPYDTQQSLLKLRDELYDNGTCSREVLLKINSCLNSSYTPYIKPYQKAVIESKIK